MYVYVCIYIYVFDYEMGGADCPAASYRKGKIVKTEKRSACLLTRACIWSRHDRLTGTCKSFESLVAKLNART
jgi:hypothetical protein